MIRLTTSNLDRHFLEAMIKLKEDNIIEFQSRMSQFKTQLQQQESTKAQNDNIPRCPTCSSTNLTHISTTSKVVNVAMFGLLGQKRKHQFKCNNCGYEW